MLEFLRPETCHVVQSSFMSNYRSTEPFSYPLWVRWEASRGHALPCTQLQHPPPAPPQQQQSQNEWSRLRNVDTKGGMSFCRVLLPPPDQRTRTHTHTHTVSLGLALPRSDLPRGSLDRCVSLNSTIRKLLLPEDMNFTPRPPPSCSQFFILSLFLTHKHTHIYFVAPFLSLRIASDCLTHQHNNSTNNCMDVCSDGIEAFIIQALELICYFIPCSHSRNTDCKTFILNPCNEYEKLKASKSCETYSACKSFNFLTVVYDC